MGWTVVHAVLMRKRDYAYKEPSVPCMVFGTRKSSHKPLLIGWGPFKQPVSRASFKRLDSSLASARKLFSMSGCFQGSLNISETLPYFLSDRIQRSLVSTLHHWGGTQRLYYLKKKSRKGFFFGGGRNIFNNFGGMGKSLLVSCFGRNTSIVSGGRCLLCWI